MGNPQKEETLTLNVVHVSGAGHARVAQAHTEADIDPCANTGFSEDFGTDGFISEKNKDRYYR